MADWRAGCLDRSDLAPVDNKLESTIGNMQYPYNRLETFLSLSPSRNACEPQAGRWTDQSSLREPNKSWHRVVSTFNSLFGIPSASLTARSSPPLST
jgi:hypothetical protein